MQLKTRVISLVSKQITLLDVLILNAPPPPAHTSYDLAFTTSLRLIELPTNKMVTVAIFF